MEIHSQVWATVPKVHGDHLQCRHRRTPVGRQGGSGPIRREEKEGSVESRSQDQRPIEALWSLEAEAFIGRRFTPPRTAYRSHIPRCLK